jgi:hypothetical protein
MGLFDFAFNIPQYFFWLIELSSIDLHSAGRTDLAINAKIGAYFGWNIINSQTAAQPSGWNRSKADHNINRYLSS